MPGSYYSNHFNNWDQFFTGLIKKHYAYTDYVATNGKGTNPTYRCDDYQSIIPFHEPGSFIPDWVQLVIDNYPKCPKPADYIKSVNMGLRQISMNDYYFYKSFIRELGLDSHKQLNKPTTIQFTPDFKYNHLKQNLHIHQINKNLKIELQAFAHLCYCVYIS